MKMIEALSMVRGQVQDCDMGSWREDHWSHQGVSFGCLRLPGQVAFDCDKQINPHILGLP